MLLNVKPSYREIEKIKNELTTLYVNKGISVLIENCADLFAHLKLINETNETLVERLNKDQKNIFGIEQPKFKKDNMSGTWRCKDCNTFVHPTVHNINHHIEKCEAK